VGGPDYQSEVELLSLQSFDEHVRIRFGGLVLAKSVKVSTLLVIVSMCLTIRHRLVLLCAVLRKAAEHSQRPGDPGGMVGRAAR
jgi:hypothetical protein